MLTPNQKFANICDKMIEKRDISTSKNIVIAIQFKNQQSYLNFLSFFKSTSYYKGDFTRFIYKTTIFWIGNEWDGFKILYEEPWEFEK